MSKTIQKDPEKKSFLSILSTKSGKTAIRSVIAAVAIIITFTQISSFTGITMIGDVGIVGGCIIGILPVVMIQLNATKRRDNIDRNLPFFLLAIGGAVKSGQSLIRAIEGTADRNMGSLTPEIKNLRANMSWGMPVDEAFDNFVERVDTRMARRVMVLLKLAMNIGGDVASTIDIIQKHVSEMANVEKERKTALQPYIYTIYISFAVFLGITLILITQFFTEIENVQETLRVAIEGTSMGTGGVKGFESILNISVPTLKKTVFHMTLVEAIFGGLAAGKIGESSIIAGVKHVVVMMILAVVAFMMVGVSL
ncbi:MAG: type II secretion system F family protein [Thaumarchaeota archaeon]|nr:type II secretion system F family protein [Nitrososphaerota archaeon]